MEQEQNRQEPRKPPAKPPSFGGLFSLALLPCVALVGCITGLEGAPPVVAAMSARPTQQKPSRNPEEIRPREEPPKWAIETGIVQISRRHAHQALRGQFGREDGDGEADIYKLTVTRTVHEYDLDMFGSEFHPLLELPVTVYLADEKNRHAFMSYSAALALRWVDFPWNDVVYTTTAMGLGIHYSSHIYQFDREANDDRRAHVKFAWPFQLTLAHPDLKHVQLALYSDHFSGGGGIFDIGGFDAFGLGLRVTF